MDAEAPLAVGPELRMLPAGGAGQRLELRQAVGAPAGVVDRCTSIRRTRPRRAGLEGMRPTPGVGTDHQQRVATGPQSKTAQEVSGSVRCEAADPRVRKEGEQAPACGLVR